MISITQDQIISGWNSVDEKPLVSIKCLVYNHADYVAKAIEGFLIQKTTFPFEVIIHDDASTDNSQEIIKEYEKQFPKIIKPIYETENQYSKHDGSLRKIMNAHTNGKYIAYCEGDDFWTDPNKLQMQVDFLENNSDYSLCYTKANIYNQSKSKYETQFTGTPYKSFESLINDGNTVATLTTVLRKDIYDRYNEEIKSHTHNWKMGDYPLWIYCAANGKIKYFDTITATYRKLENSASHSLDPQKTLAFKESIRDIQLFFIDYYKLENKLKDDNLFYFEFFYYYMLNNKCNDSFIVDGFIKYLKLTQKNEAKAEKLSKLLRNNFTFKLYLLKTKLMNRK